MIRSFLIPTLDATSKLEGREWPFEHGTIRWVAWQSREKHIPTIGEIRHDERGEIQHFTYRPGRLVIVLNDSAQLADAQRAADALSGLIDLVSGPWGLQLTLLELPEEFADTPVIVEEDVQEELQQHVLFEQPLHMTGMGAAHIRDEPVKWALDHLDFVLRDASEGGPLLAAMVFLFVSQLEFAFVGDGVREVLGLEEDDRYPQSAIDRVRIAESYHNAYKALEALLGGQPPNDDRRLRSRLEEAGINPDRVAGFPNHQVPTIERVKRLRQTRDKRSAHGGNTGVRSQKISFYELMDAQRAVSEAIYESLTSRFPS